MRALGLIRSQYFPLMAFLIILITCCIVLINSSKPSCGPDGTLLPKTHFNSESLELHQVLRRVSMDDRTVILTVIADEAWANPGSVLDLFLESFRLGQGTKRLLNHLLIITEGSKTFQQCNSLHSHCFQLTRLGARNNLLLDVLKLGYNFIFTEADVMWFRTPLPDIHPTYHVTVPCDLLSDDSKRENNKPGRGLFYVKSTDLTLELFRYWMVLGFLDHTFRVESQCENMKDQQEYIEMLGIQIQYLDTAYFGGFCKGGSKDMNKVYTMHANCCEDVENKAYDLRLVLEDWRNFTAQPSNFSLWPVHSIRAPTKCIV